MQCSDDVGTSPEGKIKAVIQADIDIVKYDLRNLHSAITTYQAIEKEEDIETLETLIDITINAIIDVATHRLNKLTKDINICFDTAGGMLISASKTNLKCVKKALQKIKRCQASHRARVAK